MSYQHEQPELVATMGMLLATQQQLIDVKAQLDREHQSSEGFRRFGERAFEVDNLTDFFAIVAEEVVNTFGTENAVLIHYGPSGPRVCATCCADDVAAHELPPFGQFACDAHGSHAKVYSGVPLPPLRGRPTAVLLAGTYLDKSDANSTYAVVATVSAEKAPFYPAFGPELAPLFGAFLHHIGALQQQLRGRVAALQLIRATRRFVPQEFLQALGHADVSTARLGDAVLRRMTMLFADIRNFTAISERLAPHETAAFLNNCLSRVGPHVRAHGGFIDKYIGDAIMALFPGSPADAVAAGLAMQAEISSTSPIEAAGTRIVIGIGIHVGDAMMCTIGEAERFEATVISDAVNLTARLETLSKQLGCQMLVSATVASHLPPEVLQYTRGVGKFAVKGKRQSVDIVEVFAADAEPLRSQKAASRAGFRRALLAYACGDAADALEALNAAIRGGEEDGPALWWRKHITHAIEVPDGPPELGIVRLDLK